VTIGQEARHLLRRHNLAVLSTHSLEIEGYPFGSVAPYAVDRTGSPILLLSTLAQHTRNIARDPRVALTALDPNAAEPQAASRITLVGDAAPIDKGDAATRRVYLEHFPAATTYFDFHDFSVYRIALRRVRFIGGFGKIHWVARDEFLLENPLAEAEPAILEHMNADHAEALAAYCRAFLHLDPETVQMSGIDSEGFDMLVDGVHARLAFDVPVTTPDDARKALVDLVRRARTAHE